MPTPMIAEDIITLAKLREFLTGCDARFATPSDIKSYGLSISGHTVSLVEGGSTSSVIVPDSDTTYTALSNSAIDAAVSAALS